VFAFRFAAPQTTNREYLKTVHDTIVRAVDIQRRYGNRAANQSIIDEIGVLVRFERDEAYCAEALDYHLGILHAHVGEPELADYHFERSKTHPSSGGDQLFSDHQRESLLLRQHQEQAKRRSIPSILIASMPRSGSASLTQTIAATLDIPIMRASCGSFPSYFLNRRWFNSAASGGAILHDHFAANTFNLGVLHDAPANQIFVRVRDPRPAVCSVVKLYERTYGNEREVEFEERVRVHYVKEFIPWLEEWVAVAADPDSRLKVTWLPYGASDTEISRTARAILLSLRQDQPALSSYLEHDIPAVQANFVSGDNDGWRKDLSSDGQDDLWQATPHSVRDLLALRP
jgi:hypothetical protein